MKKWDELLGSIDRGSLECPECGQGSLQTRLEVVDFGYGVGSEEVQLRAEIPVRRCMDCSFAFTDDAAEEIKHAVVCRHLGVMTPQEVLEIRRKYQMTRAEFSRITKIGEASLARWESGTVIQNAAHDQFLLLLRYPENMERLRAGTKGAVDREATLNSEPALRFTDLVQAGLIAQKIDAAPKFELRRVS